MEVIFKILKLIIDAKEEDDKYSYLLKLLDKIHYYKKPIKKEDAWVIIKAVEGFKWSDSFPWANTISRNIIRQTKEKTKRES